MIIAKLIGGLGNQLFQYALGRHLSEIHNTILKLDISDFETYKLRKYALFAFNIQEDFASQDEVAVLTIRKQGKLERWWTQIRGKRPKPASTYIREKKLFQFDPQCLEIPDNIYLVGYWQCEKYFSSISEIIRKEFTVKNSQEGQDKKLAEMIADGDSVSLHIRRGDYVSDPKTNAAHGTCDLDYYSRCVDLLTQTVKNPHFFIFSDDPEWASDNLKLPYPTTLIDHNGAEKNYEDLRLMSQCRHHIIANSSFSWWGAWLNKREDKMVFAPKQWYAKSEEYLSDVTPPQWIRL